jgi:hypothetical protein
MPMVMSSMASIRNGLARLSRRRLLEGCVGVAVASFAPRVQATASASRLEGELFAFAAPDQDDLVFALALAPQPFGQAEYERLTARLHAGPHSWMVRPFALRDNDNSSVGVRLFSGRAQRVGDDRPADHLVVIAVPAKRMPPGGFDVWAEIISAGGARARIGNPLITSLLAGDAELARLHAGLHPATDRRMLAAPIACRIATRPVDQNAEARARRLVDLMLPDTLRFDPARPAGFTFAAMNGRRPEDAVAPIVRTLLAGAPRAGEMGGRYRSSSRFPYFATNI